MSVFQNIFDPHATIVKTMKNSLFSILKVILFILLIVISGGLIWWLSHIPSNDRNWNKDQQVLPYAEFSSDGNHVTIRNIRNNTYQSTTDYEVSYYDKTFNLDEIKRVWFLVEPFAGFEGAAHTMLSFEFENDQFISVSVEIRKEVGESFSAVKGILNQYELMYVIADEQDVIKLRSNYRKDEVFLYPMKATPEKTRELFTDMLRRANTLAQKPEFYNTLINTCTTNIVAHVNSLTPNKIPLRSEILFPADADKLAYEIGLIDTTLSFEEARTHFKINDRAMMYANDPSFSIRIRE